METVSISTFKATCLELLRRVGRTGQPIRVTLRGEPIADIIPPKIERERRKWLGAARESGAVHGDLVSPTGEQWEALDSPP